MTEYEICMAYKYALNRKKQIKILSDLNVAYVGAILVVLNYNGYETSKYWSDAVLKKGREDLDNIILSEINNGLKYRDIANKLGYSYGYIASRGSALRKMGVINVDSNLDEQGTDTSTSNINDTPIEVTDHKEKIIDTNEVDKYTENMPKDSLSISEKQLLYYNTYKRIEDILKLRKDSDSDEVKQAFSELAVKILRSTIEG